MLVSPVFRGDDIKMRSRARARSKGHAAGMHRVTDAYIGGQFAGAKTEREANPANARRIITLSRTLSGGRQTHGP